MTRWPLKFFVFGAVLWLVVLVVGLVTGNTVQIVVGAVVAVLFGGLAIVRRRQR